MDIVTRKQINILIRLAMADKKVTKEERKMIFDLATEKNFPKETVDYLFQQQEPIGTLGALSQNQKFEYLYNSICLMKVDRKITQSELVFCEDIAMRMGFRKDVVRMLSDQVEIERTDSTDFESLKSQVYAYY
jgi:uncharacterized HAD superfamily protein